MTDKEFFNKLHEQKSTTLRAETPFPTQAVKIPQLDLTTQVDDGSEFIIEKSDGTKIINASDLKAYIMDELIGTIQAFAYLEDSGGNAIIPSNYLLCNGAEVSQLEYPKLYAKIGDLYGTAGNPANNFVLPQAGLFLRNVDKIGLNNPDATPLGGIQQDALQNITGTISDLMSTNSNTMGTLGGAFKSANLQDNNILTMFGADVANTTGDGLIFDASLVARTSTETRPKSLTVAMCIRAK